jgi:response regulator RpfG family c-di-GMP phosphodiesterase
MELARWIIETCPQSAVVIVSVVSDPKIAESALEIGIHGYVPKPFTPEAILINVAGAVKRKQLEEENRSHRERLEQAVKERTASLRSTISKLRKTREALRRAQESYRNLFDRIPWGFSAQHLRDKSWMPTRPLYRCWGSQAGMNSCGPTRPFFTWIPQRA